MNIVKELRKKKGIQQKELALEIGVSRPIVSEWESNKKDPSGIRLKKLAEYFGVDELVILGKGITDLTDRYNLQTFAAPPDTPKTKEARIVSFGMDQLPQEERDKIISVLQAMYANNPGLFKRGGDNET